MHVPTRSQILGYTAAVAATALALVVHWLLDPMLGEHSPFVTFYVAVIFAVWFGGTGPALLAVALSLAGGWFLCAPAARSSAHPELEDLVGSALFLVVGFACILMRAALDNARRRLEVKSQQILEQKRQLEQEVQARRETEVREQKHHEELERRDWRFRAMIEGNADLITLFDRDGRVTYVSPSLSQITGLTPEEIIGLEALSAAHPEDAPAIRKMFDALLRQPGAVFCGESRYRHKDGSWHWLEGTVINRLEDPAIHAVVGNFRDITDRKQAQAIQAAQDARIRRLVDANIIGIVFADQETIFEANEAFLRLVGYSRADVEAGRLRWHEMTPAEYSSVDERSFRELLRSGRCEPYQKEYFRQDGSRVPILMGAALLDSQKPTCVCFVVDLTEQKRAEAALKEAHKHKDEFLATLAHELRNPLAPIRNALQILRLAGDDVAAFREVRDMMERQLQQMVRLVDDLLDVSRITCGKIELRKQPLDLATVISSAVEESRPLLEAARHELTVILPPHPLQVLGDPSRLAQVISNLLNNAAKYTLDGGRVVVSAERQAAQAVLRVRDNGMGIPKDMLSLIFEMFTQVHRHLDRAQGGLGIGLTLVRSLVEMHGGSVQAYSEGLGHGSEFVVRLPLFVETTQREGGDRGGLKEPATFTVQRRILVVDDNKDSARSLARVLQMMGNEVRMAHDGPAALVLASEFVPDVVLLDIGMPGMNGYEVASLMRTMPILKKVVLVAQTGWGQEEDRQRSREAGFDHHLVKPVDLADLQQLLATVTPEAK